MKTSFNRHALRPAKNRLHAPQWFVSRRAVVGESAATARRVWLAARREGDMKSVVLIQSALGDYRSRFLGELSARLQRDFVVAAGHEHFDPTVAVIAPLPPIVRLRNVYLWKRRALWQRGAVRIGVRARVAFLEFNPRIVSVWVVLVARALLRRRSVLWGHAFPRRGPGGGGMPLRRLMVALADSLIVYTQAEVEPLRRLGWKGDILAAPNAIFRADEMRPATADDARGFVYVGRLVTPKKPGLLVAAFAKASAELGLDARLTVVGDGPLRGELQTAVAAASLPDAVTFVGHVSDLEELRRLYAGALASVSPGYVGLSITQSLGFGVTMIVSRDEHHAPEIEAAVEGVNATFFGTDDVDALARALVAVSRDRSKWLAKRDAISTAAARDYSVERMAGAFVAATAGSGPEVPTGRS